MINGARKANVPKNWVKMSMIGTPSVPATSQRDPCETRQVEPSRGTDKHTSILIDSDDDESEDAVLVTEKRNLDDDSVFAQAAQSVKKFQMRNIFYNKEFNYDVVIPKVKPYKGQPASEVESLNKNFRSLTSLYNQIHRPDNEDQRKEWKEIINSLEDVPEDHAVNAKDTLKAILSEVNMMNQFVEMFTEKYNKSEQMKAMMLMRPPGHHSHLPTKASDILVQGFCMLPNACYLLDELLRRNTDMKAVIWDFDYHKGDGTHTFMENLRERDALMKKKKEKQPKLDATLILERAFFCDTYHAFDFPLTEESDELHAHCECITKDKEKKYTEPFECDKTHIHFHGIGNEFNGDNFAVARMKAYEAFKNTIIKQCNKEKDYANYIHIVSLGFDAHQEDNKAGYIIPKFEPSWNSTTKYKGATNADFKKFGSMLKYFVDRGSSIVAVTEGGYDRKSIEKGIENFMKGF